MSKNSSVLRAEKLKEKRLNRFPIKTCWFIGCRSSTASGGLAYPWGYKDKTANWAYFCVEHWEQLRRAQSNLRIFNQYLERYDECSCCEPNRTKYTELTNTLALFRENVIQHPSNVQTLTKYL